MNSVLSPAPLTLLKSRNCESNIIWKLSLCRYNRVKVGSRPHWVTVGPKSIMTGFLIRRGKFRHVAQRWRHTGENSMWRRRQRLEWRVYQLRNTKDCWRPPEAGREVWFSFRTSRRDHSGWHLDYGFMASGPVKKYISCDHLLQQP